MSGAREAAFPSSGHRFRRPARYARGGVPRIVFLLAVIVAAAACGSSSAATHTPIVFGVVGGNLLPYHVTIEPSGVVRHSGPTTVRRTHLPGTAVARLRSQVESAHLGSRQCQGTLPDFGSQFIRIGTRTVTVHGTCEPRFTRVWTALAHAVGLRVG